MNNKLLLTFFLFITTITFASAQSTLEGKVQGANGDPVIATVASLVGSGGSAQSYANHDAAVLTTSAPAAAPC